MSASELLPSTSNTSIKKRKGKDKPEDALETDAEVKRQEAKIEREEAEVQRKEHDVKEATEAKPTSTFIHLVIRSALGVSPPSGLELQPRDRWEAFRVQAETRLRMHLTVSAVILFNSILFIAAAHIRQPPLTSTASYKAFLVTAFSSSGSVVYNICTIPRIRVICLQQTQRLVSREPTIRPVFPIVLLSVGIPFNVSASLSMMVSLTIISWELTASVGLLIFCIVFTVLTTTLCILADIYMGTITTSHDI